MPPRRQLPWANKGGGSKTQTKQPPAKRPAPCDIDDDFFAGTILESSRKGTQRADAQISDDVLPELPSKFANTSRKSRESSHGPRMLSSSPPPIAADLPPPKTEYMLTGVNKFDLRDDEWMMVEDELLQTAKLFTQHLHLAEYEILKAKMEEQRNVATARPVVTNAKPSVEGKFKRKAQEQARNQKKAIRDVFSPRDDSSDDDEVPLPREVLDKLISSFPPARSMNAARSSGTAGPLPTLRSVSNKSASDSDDLDDLDALQRLAMTVPKPSTTISKPPADKSPAEEAPPEEPNDFKKPAMSMHPRNKPARGQRRNLWDDWDELTANSKPPVSELSYSKTPQCVTLGMNTVGLSATQRSSSPLKSIHTPTPTRTGQGLPTPTKCPTSSTSDLDDLTTPTRNPLAKKTADRLAKRKADKEQDNRKKSKYDDIPTFLF